MKRDELIKLLLDKVPADAEIAVPNGLIYDEDLFVTKEKGQPSCYRGPKLKDYYLLQGRKCD